MKRESICLKCAIIIIICTITCNMTAQRASLDTLDYAQLHQKMNKAISLQDAGILLLFGPPIIGSLTGLQVFFPDSESESSFLEDLLNGLLFVSMAYACIPLMITGGIIWAVESKKIEKIDIALKKFHVPPQNSMALGVGITINFRF